MNIKPGACLERSEVRSLAGITQHSREKEIRWLQAAGFPMFGVASRCELPMDQVNASVPSGDPEQEDFL